MKEPREEKKVPHSGKLLFKKCHQCGHLMELEREIEKCTKCQKAFLPSNYFEKIHDQSIRYKDLFASSCEINDQDIIKGLTALW
jgi:hypothetical protein